jgi:hypothetical protein
MAHRANTKSMRKIGSSWPVLWLLWAGVTTLGWLGVAATSAVLGFRSDIWNPDEVARYLSRPPTATWFTNLTVGAIIGVVFGALFGLFQWKALGRTRKYAIITVAVSVIGTAVLCATSATGSARLQSDLVTTLRTTLTGGIMGGVFCGLCQWLLLIRLLPGMNRWPLMTTTGWAISWTILSWLPYIPSKDTFAMDLILLIDIPLAGGAIVGLLQWLLLRRWLRQASWWVLATAVGWAIPFWLRQISGFSVWGYALAGVIPATALVLLLRQLEPEVPPESTGGL